MTGIFILQTHVVKYHRMSAPPPQNGLALNLFKDQANNDFLELIKKVGEGDKILTFPPYLENYVIGLLNSSSIGNQVRLVSLAGVKEASKKYNLIVITPSDRDTIQSICEVMKKIPKYNKELLVIPRPTALVKQVLEDNQFTIVHEIPKDPKSEIIVEEFHADFVACDTDFFLMPCINTFYQTVIENDFTDLYSAARSLAKLQTVFGTIPLVYTAGKNAERVRDLMKGIMSQVGASSTTAPQIDTLIIIDRQADLVTPLLFTDSVEGLIDEYYGINYGICTLPKEVAPSDQGKSIFIANEENEVFAESRFKCPGTYHSFVKAKSAEIQQVQELLRDNQSGIQAFAENVRKAKRLAEQKPMLELNVNMLDDIIGKRKKANPPFLFTMNKECDLIESQSSVLDIAENYITIFDDWFTALRLIFLESQVSVNHSKSCVQKIQKEICAEFGIAAQEVFITLEKLRLLSSTQYPGWKDILKTLNVYELDDPLGETYNGCIVPMSVRLVQKATQNDWTSFSKPFEERGVPLATSGEPVSHTEDTRRVLVFFVGGVTMSEVTVIRQLGRKVFNNQVHYLVGSTDTITTKKFMKQICPGFFE